MNESIRPFSFANPSWLPAALAVAMMITPSRSASADQRRPRKPSAPQEAFPRPVSAGV